MLRRLTILLLTFGIATPAFAGDIRDSGTAAALALAQQSSRPPAGNPEKRRSYFWPGVITFAAGMGLATYGFLHTKDGEFVEPGDASELSNTMLGVGGLALAAGGGAMMFFATRSQVSQSGSRIGGGPAVGLAKRFSW